MYTFKSLQDAVLAQLDESGDTGTTLTNVKTALNLAHQQRCGLEKWTFMQSPPLTFSLVSGQTRYALDPAFARPLYFYNVTATEFLVEVPSRELESFDNWNSATDGQEFCFSGVWPVQYQPSSTSVLTIVSSSASDTGAAKAVLITGRTANGIVSESVTPTGTNSVDTTNSFSEILSLSLSAAWAGTCTITSNSAGVTNVVLTAGEVARQYPVIRLLWTPTSADTIRYVFQVQPRVMTNDGDIPNIPYPHSGILIWDALKIMAAYDNQTDGGRMKVWDHMQGQTELQMRQTYIEAQSVGARVRYVRTVDDGQTYL